MLAPRTAIAIVLAIALVACSGGTEPESAVPDAAAEPATDEDEAPDDEAPDADADDEVADEADEEADEDPDPANTPAGLGTATVTVGDERYELVVFLCVEDGNDPLGLYELYEFAGSAVSPDVPADLLAAAMAADAPADGEDPDEVVMRNLELVADLVSYGPTFGWQRWLDGSGDVVGLMLDESTGWVPDLEDTEVGAEAFIVADGSGYTGTVDVVQFPTGATAQLTFSATCP